MITRIAESFGDIESEYVTHTSIELSLSEHDAGIELQFIDSEYQKPDETIFETVAMVGRKITKNYLREIMCGPQNKSRRTYSHNLRIDNVTIVEGAELIDYEIV